MLEVQPPFFTGYSAPPLFVLRVYHHPRGTTISKMVVDFQGVCICTVLTHMLNKMVPQMQSQRPNHEVSRLLDFPPHVTPVSKVQIYLPSLKLTWHLKIGHPKRKYIFQPLIFRCYVSFREGYLGQVLVTKKLPKSPHHLHRPKVLHPNWWTAKISASQTTRIKVDPSNETQGLKGWFFRGNCWGWNITELFADYNKPL